jgi:hypothetical protein
MIRLRLMLVFCAVLALTVGVVTATAGEGNPPKHQKQLCKEGGWQNWERADHTAFESKRDCYSYVAHGGTLTAPLRTVTLIFNVTVPTTTDSTGRSVYIAGSLDRLDPPGPQSDPGGVVLTRVDATHWTITLHGKETTELAYKYTLGDLQHVEKGAACDEIADRQLTISYGASGTQDVNDAVLNWRNVAPCGN